jgi:hypothetical protein
MQARNAAESFFLRPLTSCRLRRVHTPRAIHDRGIEGLNHEQSDLIIGRLHDSSGSSTHRLLSALRVPAMIRLPGTLRLGTSTHLVTAMPSNQASGAGPSPYRKILHLLRVKYHLFLVKFPASAFIC